MEKTKFATVEEAIAEIKAGKMIVVMDDEDRENEGDLLMAAEFATPEAVNFMVTHARGLICVPMNEERAAQLDLCPMTDRNTDPHGTAFTLSVDSHNSTTGISAFERSDTIISLANPDSKPQDFRRPGHIFPLIAKTGGVLTRCGHTEAAVDLAVLAGGQPVGAICEILNDDGTMARLPELEIFAQKHQIKILTIAELIRWRREKEKIQAVAQADLPNKFGHFKVLAYENQKGVEPHLALVKGDVSGKSDVLVRIHSECLTGDIFGSCRCDCGEQLAAAMKQIEKEGTGILLYLRQEGRGIGLINKLRAYELQEQGEDTVQANHSLGFAADLRDFTIAAQILRNLGVESIRLITNNPEKISALESVGIKITQRVPSLVEANSYNEKYIQTKAEKLGHLI